MHMRIQKTHISFKRALSTEEKAQYKSCTNQAREKLGLKNTTAILFDYMVPSTQDKNIGIGSTFSENAQNFGQFLKDMFGINSLQINPQGVLKDNTFSPYSASSLSIGEHIIDVFQLTKPDYGEILSEEDIKKYLIKENPNIVTDAKYENITRRNYYEPTDNYAISHLLRKAFSKFQNFNFMHPLVQEFIKFKHNNNSWLDKESLFFALAETYHTPQPAHWKTEHQNLYLTNNSFEIDALKRQLGKTIDFYKFVQFIASKQQENSKEEFNKKGIQVYSDIPIGFSEIEKWSNKELFQKDYHFGFYDSGEYHEWGVPAPDLDKFDNPNYKEKLINLFKNRFEHHYKRYDGIRIDAAWEMVNPCVIKSSFSGNEGKVIDTINDTLLKMIENSAKEIKKEKYSPDSLIFEVLGGPEIINTKYYLKNKFPFTYITNDVINKMGTINGYKKAGFQEDFFTVGIGTHDNDSLIKLSNLLNGTPGQRACLSADIEALASNMNVPKEKVKSADFYRTIKFAELFTTKNQFFNSFDLLGLDNFINIWDIVSPRNWKQRIPTNYERVYFSNLQQNKGLNLPESLYYALKAKNINDKELENQLLHFAKILKENGPLTEAEANLKNK